MATPGLRRYDLLLKDMIFTIKEDYAGHGELWPDYQPSFFVSACGTQHHHNRMTDLMFLQYASQMLASTGDRSLRLSLAPGPEYTPTHPGFLARRYGEHLVVTHVSHDQRLTPGDLILSINGASPAQLRESLQKNFFYSTVPEREIWLGLLKMADHMLVQHQDGSREDLPLLRFQGSAGSAPQKLTIQGGTAVFAPDLISGIPDLTPLTGCDRLILDLRRCSGKNYDLIPKILDYILPQAQDSREALAQEPVLTNYTAKNCVCLWYPYEQYMQSHGEDPQIREYVEYIKSMSGKGWTEEPYDPWPDVTGELGGKGPGQVTVLADTWTENAGEALAELAAKQPNVTLIGRPTMGSLDYPAPVSKALDEDYIFTYSISKRKTLMKGHGLAVDKYVPFTPEEATEDVIMKMAMEL